MKRKMMMALSLVLMLPVVAAAQRPEARGPRDGREMPMRPPAQGVALMLEHADKLELTADQSERLKAIQARHEQRTAPLRVRADSIRPDRDGERRDLDATALRQRRQAMGEIMTLMREENQTARKEALELLSSDQRKKVEQLEDEQRKAREARRGRGGPGESGGRRGGPPA
jgi:Spy/CpxP family protein refolding chaperone